MNLVITSDFTAVVLVSMFLIIFNLNQSLPLAPINYTATFQKVYTRSRLKLSTNKTHFICPRFIGRLGNQMFQFASSYGISRFKGMKVVINANCDLLKVFDLRVDIRKDTSMCSLRKVKLIQEVHSAVFDSNLFEFDNTSNVRLTTYLQSYKYFAKYENELRKQFTFKETIQTKAIALLDSYLRLFGILRRYDDNKTTLKNVYFKNNKDKITLIGVHIRRGDYVTLRSVIGYNPASKEYLQKSVNLYMSVYTDLVFVVASDGINWAKSNMPKYIKVIYLEGHSASLDLAIITLSEHFISTVGTFSWWAGWLTGGNVTYYKWPAIEGTRNRKSYDKAYADFFFEKWIGL